MNQRQIWSTIRRIQMMCLLCIVLIGVAASDEGRSAPTAKSLKYEVKAVPDGGANKTPHVTIRNSETNRNVAAKLPSTVTSVKQLTLHGELVVVNAVLSDSNVQSITKIACETGESIQDVWGRKVSISPDGKYAALESFYPLHPTDAQVWPTVNLLRLDKTDVQEGVIFPEGGYGDESESPPVKKWFVQSHIEWKPDSSAFCALLNHRYYVERAASELYLLRVWIDGDEKISLLAQEIDLSTVREQAMDPNRWAVDDFQIVDELLKVTFRVHNKKVDLEIPFSWDEKRE
ncbi:MAG: hypothetical protein HYV27_15430 [Candidatus Hydrogenedentes bacterium]|nr:hypothetical protein [Candidatus Hydrogenedentota bacterium]